MTFHSQAPRPKRVWDDPRIDVPDEATWSAMSPDEREAAVERIREAFSEYAVAMSEGARHFRRKAGIGADADERVEALDEAEQRLASEAQRRVVAEKIRVETERQRDDLLDRFERLRVALARVVIEACARRGIALTPTQHALVISEGDAARLASWSERVFEARSADELFAGYRALTPSLKFRPRGAMAPPHHPRAPAARRAPTSGGASATTLTTPV